MHNVTCMNGSPNCHAFMLAQEQSQYYGIDWNGPCPSDCEEGVNSVAVPATECPLSDTQYDELTSTISPFDWTDNNGINLYLATLSFVHSMLM